MNIPVTRGMDGKERCTWANASHSLRRYHDEEWGVPIYDDVALFGKLILDTFQAGLSWRVVLDKRPAFLEAFDGFDPIAMAQYGDRDVALLMNNPGIIRNHAKIQASITNAQAFLDLIAQEGSFRQWLFRCTGGGPIIDGSCPTTSSESEKMARALKRVGFKFTGPIVCYAFMQATGFVMDHPQGCWRRDACIALLQDGDTCQ